MREVFDPVVVPSLGELHHFPLKFREPVGYLWVRNNQERPTNHEPSKRGPK